MNIVAFHKTVSEESVYLRYANKLNLQQRTTHDRLTRICFTDYDREIVLITCVKDKDTGKQKIIGVGRLSKIHGSNEAKFSLLISDAYQGKGLGTELMNQIIRIGRSEKYEALCASILTDNTGIQALCKKLGFKLMKKDDAKFVSAELAL